LEEARSTVQSIQTQINELKGKSGSSDSETQKLHKAVVDIGAKLTKKQVDLVNKKLMDQSPPTLTKGLESFVALLRNTQTASNIDVELYFAEFAKLSKKMMTITAHKHDLDTVSSHEKQLQAQKSEFVQEYPELEIIFEFALAFCTYAKKFCQ
jgi:hypothetical protein